MSAGCVALLPAVPAAADTGSPVTTWSQLTAAFAAGGVVTLGADISQSDGSSLTVPVGRDHAVTLDLGGYSLSINSINDQHAAINVAVGAYFTVEDPSGKGTLSVSGGNGGANGPTAGAGAGIGGDGGTPSQGQSAGSITIDGGTVDADGENGIFSGPNSGPEVLTSSPGIGGGSAIGPEAKAGDGGDVVVNGGEVDTDAAAESYSNASAQGSAAAPGIGGGGASAAGAVAGSGGRLVIRGGTVHAYDASASVNGEGSFAPAIGGGAADGAASTGGAGGTVVLAGGTLTADGNGPSSYGPASPAVGGGSGAGDASTSGAGADLTVQVGGRATLNYEAIGPGATTSSAAPGSPGTLENDGVVTVPSGSYLSLSQGQTVTNRGRLYLAGTLDGSGTVDNDGVIRGGASTSVAAAGGKIADNGNGNGKTSLRVAGRNYTLGFDAGKGTGSFPRLHVYAGTVASSEQTLPTPGAPRGTRFAGWYDREVGGDRVSDSTSLPASLGSGPGLHTLYARYAAPTITAQLSSAHPRTRYGWYRGPVTVAFTCHDHGVPLANSCPKPVTLRRQGAGQSVTRSIRTRAGTTIRKTVRGINIDTTAPSVAIAGARDGSGYLTVPTVSCRAADRLSGIASCRLTRHSKRTEQGTQVSYTARAVDKAGNVTRKTTHVLVRNVVISGAAYSAGAYTVRRGEVYTLFARTGGTRPTYVNAAPYDEKPSGADTDFRHAGRIDHQDRWSLRVRMQQRLRAHRYWNIGVWVGRRLYEITIRVVG